MSNYTFQELERLWTQAGGDPKYAPMAAAVAMAESGGNPNATNKNSNGSIDRGLWQINSVHGSQSTYNSLANARGAIAISNNGTNWKPWCTAWSNARCGGTYLGQGSPVLAHLPSGASTGSVPSGTVGSDQSTPALRAIAAAYRQVGLPYKFGAEAPGVDFDCSGLTQYAYSQAGISIPRTAAAQQAATQRISGSELRPGDLVFYGDPAHHVQLYIGGGMVISAPQTGQLIKVEKVGKATNFGRVVGSKAQDNTNAVVTAATANAGFTSGGGPPLPGGPLDPLNTPWYLQQGASQAIGDVLQFLAWGAEIVIGIVAMALGLLMVLAASKPGQEAQSAITGYVGARSSRVVRSGEGRSEQPDSSVSPMPQRDPIRVGHVGSSPRKPRATLTEAKALPAGSRARQPDIIDAEVVEG